MSDLPAIPVGPYPKLLDWQRQYAGWLVSYVGIPGITEKLAAAKVAAGYQVKKRELAALERRKDFKEYSRDLQLGETASARALIEAEATKTIEQFKDMRDAAHAAGDYDKWIKYGLPILDRIWPKQEERTDRSPHITINVGSNSFSAKALEDETVIEESDVVVLANPGGGE